MATSRESDQGPYVAPIDLELFGPYNQAMTDLLAIFWSYHKQRIELENIAFCSNIVGRPLDLDTALLDSNLDQTGGIKPLWLLAEGIIWPLQCSFGQFLIDLPGQKSLPKYWLHSLETFPQPPTGGFKADYTAQICRQVIELGEKTSQDRGAKDHFELFKTVSDGISGGVSNTVRLSALLGSDFKLGHVSRMAKISIRNIQRARAAIGMNVKPHPRSYSLLSAKGGLDQTMLEEMGFGQAVGCPVGKRASLETRTFLQDSCQVVVDNKPVLAELTQMTHHQVQSQLIPWYQRVKQRVGIMMDAEQRAVLDGVVWQTVKKEGTCPFHPNP